MKFHPLFLILAAGIPTFTSAAKILLFHPSPSKSHAIPTTTIFEELASRGHKVTVVNPFSYGLAGPNYREIVIKVPKWEGDLKKYMLSGDSFYDFSVMGQLMQMVQDCFNITLNSPEFQKLVKEETFDLVVFGDFFNIYQIGVAHLFKAPYVFASITHATRSAGKFIGDHSYPATVPSMLMDPRAKMTFKNRLINMLGHFFEIIMFDYMDYVNSQIYAEFFPPDRFPSFEETRRNCSLVLQNHHFSQGGLRPNLPNSVEISGVQIRPNPKPLPADMQRWLDEATDGVILWTFGSNVPISEIQPERLDAFLRVLGRQRQRILMKWELDDRSRLPPNAMASKWLPQASVLAHPNVRLFLTHGGAGSLYEAMYHGVPIIGVPLFADQLDNMQKTEGEGWGRMLRLADVTEESVETAVRDVLSQPRYREVVQGMSLLYKDRLAPPLDTAVYWIEYVIRHHGAPHLYYQNKDLNVFQRHSLDILAVIFIALYVYLKVTVFVVKKMCRFVIEMFSKSSAKKDKSKKRD